MDNVDGATQKISGIQLRDEEEDDEDAGPSEEEREKFNQLVSKAKKYVGEGRIEDALKLNKKALGIVYHEKLAKKIKKMEEYLKMNADESDEDEDNNGMMHLGKGLYLYKDLYKSLYAHQQEGVLWFWSLFRRKKGGILGDDMGLGKTIQVIAFLSGMFDMQKIRSVLIVLPVALMVNWEKEIEKWAPGLKVVAYHGNSKREKERALARVQRRGGICLTTYGLVVTSFEQLGTQDGREFVWDYLILDEGHKIKNPTKTSKGVHNIPAHHRVILTGTPVQNNLKELWALFDFVHQGSLLGTQRTFKMEYENPITRAREKDATVGEKKLGMEMAKSLKKIIAPYFLRRTKAEVKEREKSNKENENPNPENHAVMPTMTRKNDLIVWTFLTETQLKIYQDFLSLDSVKELLMTTKSPLVALNVLKKICDHPRLLSTRACVQLGIDGDEGLDEDFLETEAGNLSAVTRIQHVDDNILINEAGKLMFLVNLLDKLKEDGHRCLVFSQSRKMLDIMQKVVTNRGHKIMRLDGTIAQVQEREQRIRKFQTDNSYSVFLLTTQVGGVGLTLTAADRVVIYDPSWNPATDAQAVDRVFRIGQDKNVVIYRLITCGTVEEKIYRRQVFKDSITKQTTGDWKNPYRYFSKYELRELFTMDDPHTSSTQQQLEQMHGGQRRTDTGLDEHIAFLYSLDMFGISDHDLMFSQGDGGGDDQDDEEQSPESDYIQHRVQKAKELIQMESSQPISMDERHGKGQPSAGGGQGGVAMPRNWDIPKPEPQLQMSPIKQDIDLTTIGPDSPSPSRSVEIDLTSPEPKPMIKPEQNTSTSVGDTSTSMDHSGASDIKQEPIDLTASPQISSHSHPNTPNIKTEPMDQSNSESPFRKPVNSPIIKGEPMDLTSTPQFSNKKLDFSNADNEVQMRSPLKEQSVISNIFRKNDSPAVVAVNRSHNTSQAFVIDSPDIMTLNRTSSTRHGSNNTDNSGDGSLIEDSVIVDESVIMSDGEQGDANKSSQQSNISVQDIRSILEKSLCSNVGELSRSRMSSTHDSPVVTKGKRRSVCVRRVIESSEDDEDDNHSGENNENDDDNDDDANERSNNMTDIMQKGSFSHDDSHMVENDDDDDESAENVDENSFNEDGASRLTERNDESADDDDNIENPEYMNEAEDIDRESANNDDSVDNSDNVLGDTDGIEHDARSSFNAHDKSETELSKSEVREELNHIEKDREVNNSHRDSDTVDNDTKADTVDRDHDSHMEDVNEQSGEELSDEEEEEEEARDFESLSEEEQIKYNELVEAGRLYCSNRQYEEAQVCVLQALEILADEELQATAVSIHKKIIKSQRKKAMMQQQQ